MKTYHNLLIIMLKSLVLVVSLFSLGSGIDFNMPSAQARPSTISRTMVSSSYIFYVCTRDPNGKLNLRKGPSTQTSILTQIDNRTRLYVLNYTYGEKGFMWIRVNPHRSEYAGWVREDFVCVR